MLLLIILLHLLQASEARCSVTKRGISSQHSSSLVNSYSTLPSLYVIKRNIFCLISRIYYIPTGHFALYITPLHFYHKEWHFDAIILVSSKYIHRFAFTLWYKKSYILHGSSYLLYSFGCCRTFCFKQFAFTFPQYLTSGDAVKVTSRGALADLYPGLLGHGRRVSGNHHAAPPALSVVISILCSLPEAATPVLSSAEWVIHLASVAGTGRQQDGRQ